MTEPKRFPWLAVILGVGCVGVLCIGVLVVGGGAAYFLIQETAIPSVPEPVVTVPVEILEPTGIPAPVIEPTLDESTNSGPTLTGDQRLDEHSLYDDFSSDALGWPLFDDGKTILKYENQAYSFQIAEPDYEDWAYFPVDFIPYEIWFDVQGLPGQQDGTFGVFCQYQNEDNFYYVEFDLEINSYVIGQILNDEHIPLTPQNANGQYWQDASGTLKSPPTSVNRIGVTCYLDSITLFINDQWVDEVSVGQPFDEPGEAAFFVYAFDFAGENGYKVFFDNVEAWQPVQ
ncbi:MAG: hypothetical protein JW963_21785 [Anaerolineales bacterium]|nr:hypothetical protein [Anaerolineales bacterium]